MPLFAICFLPRLSFSSLYFLILSPSAFIIGVISSKIVPLGCLSVFNFQALRFLSLRS